VARATWRQGASQGRQRRSGGPRCTPGTPPPGPLCLPGTEWTLLGGPPSTQGGRRKGLQKTQLGLYCSFSYSLTHYWLLRVVLGLGRALPWVGELLLLLVTMFWLAVPVRRGEPRPCPCTCTVPGPFNWPCTRPCTTAPCCPSPRPCSCPCSCPCLLTVPLPVRLQQLCGRGCQLLLRALPPAPEWCPPALCPCPLPPAPRSLHCPPQGSRALTLNPVSASDDSAPGAAPGAATVVVTASAPGAGPGAGPGAVPGPRRGRGGESQTLLTQRAKSHSCRGPLLVGRAAGLRAAAQKGRRGEEEEGEEGEVPHEGGPGAATRGGRGDPHWPPPCPFLGLVSSGAVPWLLQGALHSGAYPTLLAYRLEPSARVPTAIATAQASASCPWLGG